MMITGQKEMMQRIDSAQKEYISRAEQALNDLGNNILRESRDIAPIDTGLLRKTSKNTKTGKLERTISYNTPYAVRMHEHPEYNFQSPGEGKYLEKPIMQHKSTMLRDLQKKIEL